MDNVSLFFQIFSLNGQNAILDKLMLFGTTYLIYLSYALILFLGIKGEMREKKSFLLITLALPIAILLIKTIHIFYFEQRPFVIYNFLPITLESADASFPSRHATISAVAAFAYTYFKSKWALLLLPIMLWIGLSRIYVGVHFPLDVIGGFVVGAISVFLATKLKRLIFSQILKNS